MSAPKKAAAHPTYDVMLKDAIVEIKDRAGATKPAIIKALKDKYGNKLSGGVAGLDVQIGLQLKRLVAKGLLVKPTAARFKLTDAGKKIGVPAKKKVVKKPAAKKPAAKKPAAKKPAAKKATGVKKTTATKKTAAKPKKTTKPKAAKAAAKPKAKPAAKKPAAKKPAAKKAAKPAAKKAAAKPKKA